MKLKEKLHEIPKIVTDLILFAPILLIFLLVDYLSENKETGCKILKFSALVLVYLIFGPIIIFYIIVFFIIVPYLYVRFSGDLSAIPPELITKTLCLAAVKKDPEAIIYVPDEYLEFVEAKIKRRKNWKK